MVRKDKGLGAPEKIEGKGNNLNISVIKRNTEIKNSFEKIISKTSKKSTRKKDLKHQLNL